MSTPKYYLKGYKQAKNNDNEKLFNSPDIIYGMHKQTWNLLRMENHIPEAYDDDLILHLNSDTQKLHGFTIPKWGLTLKLKKD